MPIISNANHDFSNLSVSDDSSLDRIFTEIPETETIKGAYYKRAQFIRRPEDLVSIDHALLAVINVGGNRYTFPWSTLEQFPLTRLGRLCGCQSPEDIASVCDDYDEAHKEFFFDRSPSAFRVILNFLAAGKLRLLREMCVLSLHDELTYWGVEMTYMERCCKRKMYTRIEEVHDLERREEECRQRNAMQRVTVEETRYRKVMNWLRDMMENPQSGLPGKIFACMSVIMVAVTVVSLCISTMPDLREEEDRGECSSKCYNMFIIETVCVAWFSLEFILRFIQARSKLDFLRGPLNIIDAMAILPYYVSLVVTEEDPALDHERPGGGKGYLDKLGLVLRILRALRILYVMRLARHSLGLQTLGLTVRRSTREFGLLLLFLCVAVTLFSPLVHLAESELTGTHDFSSIPASYWWAIISMTTVGYGDMVPRSIPGQVVALSSILSGILIMAFPATSIFHMFSRSYQELKMEHDRLFKEECAAAAAAAAAAGELEEEGGEEGGGDSAPPGLGLRLAMDSVHSLESLALLGKRGESAGNDNHSLPAAAF
ncbi:potassium voltage-gated channel subfamily G member 4a [Siniperca chuatsi]|uniref:potassium voltage-gated channel subfamily G member 4a n=1 Tax=Siniperca chuatsi TaxID=119488 RepID=UPI001CE14C4D|nr:potassium voltage-gated channel subfamily G member 4a [Siniperca chuatsi]XP_044049845.1 potassium voltage-gated channel subfamily G member 4a [Siniperca chuatsi]XP_044049846.1 potassium voltage-gated channel subfamily G member 4a [Siniperca chuatsi]XP_044049847.1 potassium voltage-gated channel subfamily G member 4a [Siniperca chuatsi]